MSKRLDDFHREWREQKKKEKLEQEKREIKSDLVQQYFDAKYFNDIRRKKEKEQEPKLDDFYSVKTVYLDMLKESVFSVAVVGSGQTRVVGPKDGIISRFSPSAAKPQRVKESENIFIRGLDFLSRINPDLLTDTQELLVYDFLEDFLHFTEHIDESTFNKRVSASHKISLRRYQRAHKQRIKQRNKNRKKTVAGIIKDILRKKREKIGQNVKGRQIKKNHVSGGEHRRAR
jgi:hypothetical protein